MSRATTRCAAACLLVLSFFGIWVSPAAAHTGFESSDPTDGALLDEPVELITLVFSGDAQPTGPGFEILDPAGTIRESTDASTSDGRTWVLRFDPPLSGGVFGVRWTVKAPDAHPIDGSFSFTTPEAVVVPVDEPVSVPSTAPVDEPVTVPSTTPVVQETTAPIITQTFEPGPNEPVVSVAVPLEDFLNTSSEIAPGAQRVGAVGRFVALFGTLVGVGGLVFAATTMRGNRDEFGAVLSWVRRGGVIVAFGAVIAFLAQVVTDQAGDWASALSLSAATDLALSAFGVATMSRLAGGLLLATSARVGPVSASGSDDDDRRWHPGKSAPLAIVGALLVVVSHVFDGHTVTKGNRLLTGVVDVIHVAGGAIWAGGVLMLAYVLWRRHRGGRGLQARELAVRFSVIATIAIVVVGLAGVLLAVIILDSPSEIWETAWGRVLIAKTVLVAVAAAAGGYNHRVLVPLLDANPDDHDVSDRFRRVVGAEALVLIAVAAATALLMGAAS